MMATYTGSFSSRSQIFAGASSVQPKILPPASAHSTIQSVRVGCRICVCCMPFPTSSEPAAVPILRDNHQSLLKDYQPKLLHEENDSKKIRDLVEGTRIELQRRMKPLDKLTLIDTLDRLGISYLFEEDINALLEGFVKGQLDEDLQTTALRFRLLRHNGYKVTSDVFSKFTDFNGNFIDSSTSSDILGLLSLYEASHMGADEEAILKKAMEFAAFHLRNSFSLLPPRLYEIVSQALELPRHRRMVRLEARRYIKEYGQECHHKSAIFKLAKFEYNRVQALHQMELAEVKRWWKHLGLVDKLSFARNRPLECFLWTVGSLPEPKYSACRIELAKTVAILLVIDDIFDTFGKMDELHLFTNAIRRWDLNAIEELPEYMKICYMALYNTTNEICYKILKEHGRIALPFLKSTWIDMIEGFMAEAKWFSSGRVPNLEEYMKTSVSTAGAYMALVHLFFLTGEGVTEDNVKLLVKPYPRLFSCSGRILRLWDDLGTSKEEQERGDLASSIQLYMRENNIQSDNEARKHILQLINGLWRELNGELISPNTAMPLVMVRAAFNMARSSQVVYQHEDDSYHSSVDNYVQALFFTPVD